MTRVANTVKNWTGSRLKETKGKRSPVTLEIRRTPGVCGGRACIGDTRIPVWLIATYFNEGISENALLQSYPQLTPKHLRLVRKYCEDHKKEIERDIRVQNEDEEAVQNG